MLYAMLAYHEEDVVTSWSPEEDRALMVELMAVHNRLVDKGAIGPAARLDLTEQACTIRTKGGKEVVMDGPFAETKEQLLGLYVLNCETREEAVEIGRELRKCNPSAVYEIRPIMLYVPGAPVP